MRSLLHQARFFTTVNHLHELPSLLLPEVAFAGRSNVGKSTAINALCDQKRLAFASKTPGRTQYINYFAVGPSDAPSGHLVDLPGYGYAKVPKDIKKHWQRLLPDYLQMRAQLRGLILMMDSRHPDSELDWRMIDWFALTGKPIHILLTKADKLTRQQSLVILSSVQKKLEKLERLKKLDRDPTTNALTVQLFSALIPIGVENAQRMIESWLTNTAHSTAH